MERMLEDYLAFASESDEAAVETIELSRLVGEVAGDVGRTGRAIESAVPITFLVEARPTALRRALDNLVGNALRHAERVRISAEGRGEDVLIHVDDDGPGIPRERRAEAMRPFTRLDPARHAAGTGLGLSIVGDIARGHGGALRLGDSPLGGLRATISLPC